MNASFIKRGLAYIIDFLFITSIFMIIDYFLIKIDDTFIMENINNITEGFLENKISFKTFLEEYSIYLNELDKKNIIYNSINVCLMILYFVIIPVITKGKTLGKHILKIKIEKINNKKLNIFDTFIRSIINVGILYSIISIIILYLVKPDIYLIILIILGIIQFLLVITSVFMILYSHDKSGLQDILSRSIVVDKEVKEWENLQNKN